MELTDELAAAIGRVAAESARMELVAGLVFKRLLQSDLGELVAMGQTWATVHASCLALIRHIEPSPSLTELQRQMGVANELWQKRNRVIHGHWVSDAEGTAATVLPRRYGQRAVDSWTAPDLVDLTRQIVAVADNMLALTDRLPH